MTARTQRRAHQPWTPAEDVATIPDPQAREWVEWIPQQQLVLARRIARRCRPRSRVRAEARRAA